MKLVAVMPAYNEERRIGAAVAGVRPFVHDVVVVDDGSKDATARVAREAGARVLVHALNRGQGAALKTGNAAALMLGAEVIVHIDADGQHDPSYIPSLVEPIRRGEADVVYGSRFLGIQSDGMPFSRKLLLQAARRFSVFALGIPLSVTDPQSGYRALSASSLARVNFYQDRMAHCSELLRNVVRSGLRYREVPVKVRYTAESLAKGQRATDAFKIVWQLMLGRR